MSGYGGFGTGGVGLPGGQVGPGSRPGYPVGTGVCFYLFTLYCSRKVEKTKKCLIYFFLPPGVGPGGISPAQAKAAKYGSYHIHYQDSALLSRQT